MEKLALVLVSVLLFSSTIWAKEQTKEMQDDDNVKYTNIIMMCNESFRIDISFIKALDDSGSFPDETDRTPKCFMRCVLEKSGVATEDGVYDPQNAAKALGGERGGKAMNDVEDIARNCTKGRDEPCKCERAYQFVKCVMEKQLEEYEKAS